jgi:hypothetical protein
MHPASFMAMLVYRNVIQEEIMVKFNAYLLTDQFKQQINRLCTNAGTSKLSNYSGILPYMLPLLQLGGVFIRWVT